MLKRYSSSQLWRHLQGFCLDRTLSILQRKGVDNSPSISYNKRVKRATAIEAKKPTR